MDQLSGAVERITYYNAENGYSVVRLRPSRRTLPGMGRDGLVTVVGNLPELAPGEHVRLQGRWVTHAKHGEQFQVEICEQTVPATVSGIRRYLGSGLIKGIGPKLAERIVDEFGAETLEVIESQPKRLQEVPDIGPKRVRLILAAWQEQKHVKEIMLFLHSHGVSTNLAIKIYKQYGDQSLATVQSDPYQLARDIYGVGFKTADRLAQDLGLPPDHPSRIEAGVIYALDEQTEEGNVYTPRQALTERAAALLEVSPELVTAGIERLTSQERVRLEPLLGEADAPPGAVREETPAYLPQAVYLPPLYYSETGSAEKLRQLAAALPSRLSDLPPMFLALDPDLSAEQQGAVKTALTHPVSVLTGGPGTGKTTAIQALIAALETGHKKYALASPTGRAAKRLSEATGRPASTIHRLLGYSPAEGFKFNAEHPLEVDLLVVDEASMLDLVLAYNLLKALAPGTHLVLVGDVDQLPSVGAGDVLRDVIRSGIAPVTRLSVIFRQAAGSHIITNAHRINQGELPIFDKQSRDFFLFPAEEAEAAADWVIDVVTNRIPAKFGLNAKQDVQVLAPMYRGAAGVNALNERLQTALNPPGGRKPEKSLFGQVFRAGDKVMQVQNDYEKDVFNGDIGLVAGLDLVEHSLTVDFDGRKVAYDWSEADQLVLAYAVSVHKAQGAEFPAVVMPLVTQHYLMLQRNLLYTGVTRARQLCVLVGSRRAMAIAVNNNPVASRYTSLAERLEGRGIPRG
ncbi:MAG: ATP-dependent RecD-like DNA helicase [Anaerolineales bacterium]|jgi:exodeoxyribonuclease V alpha subunit